MNEYLQLTTQQRQVLLDKPMLEGACLWFCVLFLFRGALHVYDNHDGTTHKFQYRYWSAVMFHVVCCSILRRANNHIDRKLEEVIEIAEWTPLLNTDNGWQLLPTIKKWWTKQTHAQRMDFCWSCISYSCVCLKKHKGRNVAHILFVNWGVRAKTVNI